jgi:peptide/nickel transport system permease protein
MLESIDHPVVDGPRRTASLSLPPLRVYFIFTMILSLVGWTTLARVVRSKFIAARRFVMAARKHKAAPMRIIFATPVPSFASHIIAAVSLAVTRSRRDRAQAVGIGLRPPVVNFGHRKDAQNGEPWRSATWLLWPGAFVALAVLAFNFLGDTACATPQSIWA